jgi:HemY protein
MKQLIGFLLVVVFAVAFTLAAQGNTSKVLIFYGQYRIDLSLNFAILTILFSFFIFYVVLRTWRASSQLPGKFRQYWLSRKQKELLQANTRGLIALITGDEQGSQKALDQARKTGIETDLSYLIRAMSAIQSGRFDIAEEILKIENAKVGEHAHALVVLNTKVAFSKFDFVGALSALDSIDTNYAHLPQIQKLRLFALIGLCRWNDALIQYRVCDVALALTKDENNQAITKIYTGLFEEAGQDRVLVQQVVSKANNKELGLSSVLLVIANSLLKVSLITEARIILETSLKKQFNTDFLLTYRQVALLEPRAALPQVEHLLNQYSSELRLLELAAEVYEREQLWGKAIVHFESVYDKQASAYLAAKLERLYERVNQVERARMWREKLNNHLQTEGQLV